VSNADRRVAETGEAILKQIKSAKPTPALRRLMRDGD
jgi:hypothetical protein